MKPVGWATLDRRKKPARAKLRRMQVDAAVASELDSLGFVRQQQPRAGGAGKRQPPADGLEFELTGDGASERHGRMVGLGTPFSHVWGNSAGEMNFDAA